MTARRWGLVLAIVALAGGLAYLRDPPWAAEITSGLRPWEEDPPGTRFRWTTGRASFFVPRAASEMTLPLKAVFQAGNGAPAVVSVHVDDRWLADVALPDPRAWVNARLPLPRRSTTRRVRRVDLHVNRVIGPYLLGVETGTVTTR